MPAPPPGLAPSQRQLQVSPTGRHVAWRGQGVLHLRDLAGFTREIADFQGEDVRFSPDGRHLAVVLGSGPGAHLAVLDLEQGQDRDFGAVPYARWLEWTRKGVAVLHAGGAGQLVTLQTLAGPHWTLASVPPDVARLVAAGQGSRIAWFQSTDETSVAWQVDGDRPGEPARVLWSVQGHVQNAEMSPDGAELAVVTTQGLFVAQGGRAPERLDLAGDVRSLWYAQDGSLAWANPNHAMLRHGRTLHRLDVPDGDIATLRLVRGGDGLLLVRSRSVQRWLPTTGTVQTLRSLAGRGALLYADLFAGRVLAAWDGTFLHDDLAF